MTIQERESTSSNYHYITLAALIAIIVLALLLWSEIGLKRLLPIGEVWAAYHTVATEQEEILFPEKWPNRPLRWVPHWIPYQMDTDSFLGYNVFLVMLFVLRGMGVFLLLRQLFKRNNFIPVAATAIYMVYPAGTGWFDFSALTNNAATVVGYVALWLLLLYWNQPRPWLWLFIWSTQVISLLTYEQMYGVFAVAPALFWWLERSVSLNRRFFRVTALWYLSLLPTAIYFAYVMFSGQTNTYINSQMDKLENQSIVGTIVDNMVIMYQDHIVAWSEQVADIEFMSRHLTVALLAGLLFAGLSWFSWRDRMPTIPVKQVGWLILGSIFFMAVAFAHFSFFADQTTDNLRLYFVTTLGAAVVIAVLLDQLRRLAPAPVIAGLMVALVTIGAVDAQQQLRLHGEEGMEIQRLVAAIVEQFHEFDNETRILVIDDGQRFTDPLHYARSHHLQKTLLSIYQDTPKAYMCSMTQGRDRCVFTEEMVELRRVRKRGPILTPIPYDNLLIFRTLPGTEVEFLREIPPEYYASPETLAYDPRDTVKNEVPLPDHIKDWFACWELKNCEW